MLLIGLLYISNDTNGVLGHIFDDGTHQNRLKLVGTKLIHSHHMNCEDKINLRKGIDLREKVSTGALNTSLDDSFGLGLDNVTEFNNLKYLAHNLGVSDELLSHNADFLVEYPCLPPTISKYTPQNVPPNA